MTSAGYEIVAYNSDRTVMRAIDASDCGEFSGTREANGNFSDWSVSVSPAKVGVLSFGDCVEAYFDGVMRHRGYVSDINNSDDDMGDAVIKGYGRSFDLTGKLIVGWLQYPDKVDVSQAFLDIAAEFTSVHTDVVVLTEGIGVYIDYLDTNGKSCKQALDALLDYCRSLAVWGMDVDPATGADRLYFLRIGFAKITVEVPGPSVGTRSVKSTVADVKNIATLTGGQPWYPQLMPNPSFEVLRRVQDVELTGGNLLDDGSFQGSGWTLSGGAVIKTNGHGDPDALFSDRVLELDHILEAATQDKSPLIRPIMQGKEYQFGTWYRPEVSADPLDPPVVRATMRWTSGGTDLGIGVFDSFTADRQAWQLYHTTLVGPAIADAADGIHVKLQQIGGSTGDNRGVIMDGVYLTDGTLMYPEGWKAIPFGDAVVLAFNSFTQIGFPRHGRTCLYVKIQASDSNGHDVQIVYGRATASNDKPQGYTAQVIGGRTYRYVFYAFFEAGWAMAKVFMAARWRRQDGSVITQDNHVYDGWSSDPTAGWQPSQVDITAPDDAVGVEAWVTVRGNCEMYMDTISLRDIEDPYIDDFLDAGSLTVTRKVTDVLTSTDGEAYNSISLYGPRETSINASDVVKIEQAISYLSEYFRVQAVASKTPPLSIYDSPTLLMCGTVVNFVGESSHLYDSGLSIMRATSKIGQDGLEDQIEVGRVEPTDSELYADLLIYQDNAIRSTGASVSQPAVSSYGGSITPGIPGSTVAAGTLTGAIQVRGADGSFAADDDFTLTGGIGLFGGTTQLESANTGSMPSGSTKAAFSFYGVVAALASGLQHLLAADNSGYNVVALWNKATANAFSAMAFWNATGNEYGAVGYGNADATTTAYPFQGAVYVESSGFPRAGQAPVPLRLVQTGTVGGVDYSYCRLGIEGDGSINLYPLINNFLTAKAAPIMSWDATGVATFAPTITNANATIITNKSATGYASTSYRNDSSIECLAVGHGNSGAANFAGESYVIATGGGSTAVALRLAQYATSYGFKNRISIVPSGHTSIWAPSSAIADADMANSEVSFYTDGSDNLHVKRKSASGTITTQALGGGGGGSSVTSILSNAVPEPDTLGDMYYVSDDGAGVLVAGSGAGYYLLSRTRWAPLLPATTANGWSYLYNNPGSTYTDNGDGSITLNSGTTVTGADSMFVGPTISSPGYRMQWCFKVPGFSSTQFSGGGYNRYSFGVRRSANANCACICLNANGILQALIFTGNFSGVSEADHEDPYWGALPEVINGQHGSSYYITNDMYVRITYIDNDSTGILTFERSPDNQTWATIYSFASAPLGGTPDQVMVMIGNGNVAGQSVQLKIKGVSFLINY